MFKTRLKSFLYCLSALLAGTGTDDGYLHGPSQPQNGKHWSKGGDCEVYICMQCINANMFLLSQLKWLGCCSKDGTKDWTSGFTTIDVPGGTIELTGLYVQKFDTSKCKNCHPERTIPSRHH